MAPIGSCIQMPSHQGEELFERIRRIRIHGLVGGSMALGVGFEVSKTHARTVTETHPEAQML